MPPVIHFSDPAPAPVEDRPAASRAIGTPPLRLTSERYSAEGGALSVGDWECEPGAWRIAFHPGRHEFFQVLAGRLRIVEGERLVQEVEGGRTRVHVGKRLRSGVPGTGRRHSHGYPGRVYAWVF